MSRYRLTKRGERVLEIGYTLVIMVGSALFLLALLGLAGWVETLP